MFFPGIPDAVPVPDPSPFPPGITPALRDATLTDEVAPTMGMGRFEKTSFLRTRARMVYETRRGSASESVSIPSVDASGCEGSGECEEGVDRWRTASGLGRLTNLPSRR